MKRFWRWSLGLLLIAALSPAPQAQGDDVKGLLQRAQLLLNEQRLDEAAKLYQDVLSKEPRNPLALFELGWINNEKHLFEQAIKYLQQFENGPDAHKAYSELGFAYRKLGKGSESRDAYQKACKAKDDYAPAWLGLGDVLFQINKDYAGAARAYEKALSLSPGHAVANYRLGWCHNDGEAPAKALPYLENAVRLEPKYQAAFVELAFCRLKLGKPKEALEACKRAIALDQNSVLGHYYAGLAYLGLEQKEQVRNEIDALKKIAPERALKLEERLKTKKS